MRVLVIGSGGREHALCWKLKQSPEIEELYCAPGNGGIAEVASCVPIAPEDTHELAEFAAGLSMDLTVVGPELPLTLGIVDEFNKRGLTIFGPNRLGAELEGSKVFSKQFMLRNGIPTPGADLCESEDEARAACKKRGFPVVLKADGLAAGKGVAILKNGEDMEQALQGFFRDRKFGNAASKVLVEECVEGEEVSFMVLVDGARILPLASAKDYKRLGEGDTGPNTGGMGAHSPAVILDKETSHKVMTEVIAPAVAGMAREGREYRGVLYAGLMLTEQGLKVLEFNCRFGDPECQPLLLRLKSDLVEVIEAAIDGRLNRIKLKIDPRPTVCVVMASEGYPGKYPLGKAISGLNKAAGMKDVMVFHAGTVLKDRRVVTAGGRVLGVTAIGADISAALDNAYRAVAAISWPGCYFRPDIAHRALSRMQRKSPAVGILMGSDSDLPVMQAAADFLKSVGISYEMRIASAHRTPEQTVEYARTAAARGLKVLIAGAGMSAHLAGVVAAHTTLPVIGVPLDASALNGLDALLSTVQMPPGIPVATMGIGKAGAKNAAILAAQILSLSDSALAGKLEKFKEEMAREVDEKNRNLARA